MTVNHCDGVRMGVPCRTLFAVGLMACPHCKSTEHHEFGTWPEDEEHPMSPKIRTVGHAEPVDESAGEPRDLDAEAPAASPVPDGTINDVLDWVGDDPERAGQALEAEEAGKNRSTLVKALTDLLEDATSEVGEATDEPREQAGPDLQPGETDELLDAGDEPEGDTEPVGDDATAG